MATNLEAQSWVQSSVYCTSHTRGYPVAISTILEIHVLVTLRLRVGSVDLRARPLALRFLFEEHQLLPSLLHGSEWDDRRSVKAKKSREDQLRTEILS